MTSTSPRLGFASVPVTMATGSSTSPEPSQSECGTNELWANVHRYWSNTAARPPSATQTVTRRPAW